MSRKDISSCGCVRKKLNCLRVISSKTASAKESFCMSTAGKDLVNRFWRDCPG